MTKRDSIDALFDEFHRLYVNAAMPSVRKIAARVPGQVSHNTVAEVLSRKQVPRLKTALGVAQALGGDLDTITRLWTEAQGDHRGRTIGLAPSISIDAKLDQIHEKLDRILKRLE